MSLTSRSRPLPIVIIIVVLLVVAVVVSFPLWRPLLVDDVVSEDFPGTINDEQRALFDEMATDNAPMAATMITAATSPDTVVPAAEQPMPTMNAPAVLTTGSFVTIDAIHGAQGSATIYEADGLRILRFEDFRATNGPDLHVILSRADAPRSHDELGEDYVDLGMLKGNVGNQNYEIPTDLDLSVYRSVVIYCVPFQVVFSTATLTG
jgi:hypothetical protein